MNDSVENLLQYSHLGLIMFVIMILGWYGGMQVDEYLGTGSTGENIGFFLGLGAGFLYVFLEIFRLRRQMESGDESNDRPTE